MAQLVDDLISTRSTLIGRLKNWQDQASWQDFFDTYWRLIYGVARKTGLTETEAQDVVQETMISVAKHMPEFNYDRANGSFRAWLLTMTRWRITDQFRKRARHAERHAPNAGTDTGTSPIDKIADKAGSDLDKLWNAEWENTLVEAAITKVKRKLDPQLYQLFDLYVNKEWAPEKVATTFEVSVGQVYQAKHRVTEMIKEEVKRQVVKMG